jgi:hypothetical protein
MAFWNRRRSIEAITSFEGGSRLKATMSWPHLIALGVGAIVGTGIYTLIGVGAAKAGPAVMLAFLVAGLVCVFAALAYAELATMIPASGSAYTYSYAALGEMLAWVIGWSLILEYSLVVSAVAPATPVVRSQARNVSPLARVPFQLAAGTKRTRVLASAANSFAVVASGLPKPVRCPATSKMSFRPNDSPCSGPLFAPPSCTCVCRQKAPRVSRSRMVSRRFIADEDCAKRALRK